MMNTLPTPTAVVSERQPQLGAVNGQRIQQWVRQQRQRHCQPPVQQHLGLAVYARHQQGKRAGQQRQIHQGMAFGAVQHHVEHGIAMVNQHIQVRQGTRHTAPQGGLPHGGAATHDGHADGGAKRKLCE
jgi:hypothetical protein